MEWTTTFKQFMDKFGGKKASEIEKILKDKDGSNLDEKYYWFLLNNFENLPEEEKLKFTVKQAKKIKSDKFVKEKFCYITIAEMKSNESNANENLSEFAKGINREDFAICLSDFLINYFVNFASASTLSDFNIEGFLFDEVELLIKYKDFFLFINKLLKQKYVELECEDFIWEMKQNPQNVFDYLTGKRQKINTDDGTFCDLDGTNKNWEVLIYLYLHTKFEEQTLERFAKLSNTEKFEVINYAKDNKFNINITQEHVNLIDNDYYKSQAQKILDSISQNENGVQNIQANEIKENKSNKFCEVIKLFFATLFSLGSIASIIVGAVALVSLLTLPFSPWIFVGVGVPVLITALICLGKFANDLINLSSMANESNVKKKKSDDNSVIPQKNDKENNILEPEVQEEEEDKREIDLNN